MQLKDKVMKRKNDKFCFLTNLLNIYFLGLLHGVGKTKIYIYDAGWGWSFYVIKKCFKSQKTINQR